MPTFSDRYTVNTVIVSAALFLTALVIFELGPFAPYYPPANSDPLTQISEHACPDCGHLSFFTSEQLAVDPPFCRQCKPMADE